MAKALIFVPSTSNRETPTRANMKASVLASTLLATASATPGLRELMMGMGGKGGKGKGDEKPMMMKQFNHVRVSGIA